MRNERKRGGVCLFCTAKCCTIKKMRNSVEDDMATTHDDTRPERLDLRIAPERKDLLKRAAALRRQSLTDFVISSAEKEAEATIRAQQTMTLSDRDSAAFVDALLNPPEPNDALRAAARRYRS